MSECLFCKIIKKEIPASIFYEDESNIAFLDVDPHALGHTMVISKTHSKNILDLEDSRLCSLFGAVKKVVKMLDVSLVPEGFTIGINQGEAAGQVIEHLHVHVMPRHKNDNGGSIQSIVSSKQGENIEEIKDIIINKNK